LKLAIFNSYFFMILILSCSFLFILKLCAQIQGCRLNFYLGGGGGREQKKHQDREIVPISLPPFYQWRVRGRTGYAPRAHLKGTLHQDPRVKMKTFSSRNTHFRKKYQSLENFSLFSCEKTLHPGLHLTLITAAQQRTTMVGESWNVFTIRVLVEKRISGSRPSLALFCRRPCSACKNTA